jgi:SAM-dependent methyltransferase
MASASSPLSAQDAERLRRFERQRHDSLALSYHDFFTPITALAIQPLLDAAGAGTGSNLLDIATGPGSVAAKARDLGAACIGVDLSPE